MRNILSKAMSFVVAFIIGAGMVSVVTGGATPANAEPYGGCAEAGRYPGTIGNLQCAVDAEGEDWRVKATRDRGHFGIQFRTDDTDKAHRWQVVRNGKVIASWKSAALGWWEQGSTARTTQYDFGLIPGKRYVFTLKRDGERVYRSGVIR